MKIITKLEIFEYFNTLESNVRKNICSDKEAIINQVGLDTTPGGEHEGIFVKKYLSKCLQDVFQTNVVVEGINSNGRTQFKLPFFGTKPAPDFVIQEPLSVIGEVKYCKLNTREVGTAIGQTLLYLAASKAEPTKYAYGCVVYFDTSMKSSALQKEERNFVDQLWKNTNIYLIII